MLKRIIAGEGRSEDLGLLLDVANRIEGHTICALGDAAAWPVQSFLKHFGPEFKYMIENKGRSIVEAAGRTASRPRRHKDHGDDTVNIEVNGVPVMARKGQMIMQATDPADIYIPRFCYHDKLSVAANCRMCLVEVEKAPKPLPACATPVTEGMKVFTRRPRRSRPSAPPWNFC